MISDYKVYSHLVVSELNRFVFVLLLVILLVLLSQWLVIQGSLQDYGSCILRQAVWV